MAPKFAGLFAILGLDARSKPGPNEIKKAFHAIALRLHPDKNPYDSRATAKFQNAVKAYEKLLSTCVNIEEEPEPKVTRSEEPEEEEEHDSSGNGRIWQSDFVSRITGHQHVRPPESARRRR